MTGHHGGHCNECAEVCQAQAARFVFFFFSDAGSIEQYNLLQFYILNHSHILSNCFKYIWNIESDHYSYMSHLVLKGLPWILIWAWDNFCCCPSHHLPTSGMQALCLSVVWKRAVRDLASSQNETCWWTPVRAIARSREIREVALPILGVFLL